MLLLTRESDYAVICMLSAADSGHIAVSEVARRHNLSASFLGNIVASLARAGLVVTRRGARGGFSLSRPTGDITILQVVEAIQGPLNFNTPADLHPASSCSRKTCCSAAPVFAHAEAAVRTSLGISLADVLADKMPDITVPRSSLAVRVVRDAPRWPLRRSGTRTSPRPTGTGTLPAASAPPTAAFAATRRLTG